MNWLQGYLVDAIQRNVCTKVGCTTCGAREFRTGLLAQAAKQMQRVHLGRLNRDGAVVIARALNCLIPPDTVPVERFEAAVRLILTSIWAVLGEVDADRLIEPLLSESWAGDLLARMKRHYAAVVEERKRFEEEQDPVRVEARRAEKRRQRQVAHEERLATKRKRDAGRLDK